MTLTGAPLIMPVIVFFSNFGIRGIVLLLFLAGRKIVPAGQVAPAGTRRSTALDPPINLGAMKLPRLAIASTTDKAVPGNQTMASHLGNPGRGCTEALRDIR